MHGMEREMATHYSILAGECHGQKILVGLHESMGSQRISQDQATKPNQNKTAAWEDARV